MKGKSHLKIDLLNLYATTTAQEWNKFLAVCKKRLDLQTLEHTLYGVQLGMDDLVNKKLNTEKMSIWFVRIQRSIEKTMRDIIREKNPNPLDNPLNADKHMAHLGDKRHRDHQIEQFLKKVRF